MKLQRLILVAAFVAVAVIGCASEPVSDVVKITSLYGEIKDQGENLTDEQIKAASKKLDDIKDEIDLKSLSAEQRQMVEKLSQECSKYLESKSAEEIKRDVERFSKDAKQVLDVLLEALKE